MGLLQDCARWSAAGIGIMRSAALLGVCGIIVAGSVHATTVDAPAIRYDFATAPYERIVDPVATPTLSYTQSMGLEISVYLDDPLLAGLDQVALTPRAVGFNDGVHADQAVDLSRFTGWVSTGPQGTITDFFVQIYRDAAAAPGVWIRRLGGQVEYKVTRSQHVVMGYADACPGWTDCPPIPLSQWVTDRAEGGGPVRLSKSHVATLPGPDAPPAPIPGPASFLLLVTALGLLGWRRRACANARPRTVSLP